MTMTFSASNCVDGTSTASAPTIVLPSDVPAGASIVGVITNRTDESTTLTSVSDPVNGTWSTSPDGPHDLTGASIFRVWFVYLPNSAALTGTANRTITITFSGSIANDRAFGWLSDDGGAATFQAFGTVRNSGSVGETDVHSNTIAASGAGGLVGFMATGNQQSAPQPVADGAGESRVSPLSATGRAHLFFEAISAASTVGIETTIDNSSSIFNVGVFLSPGLDPIRLRWRQ